HLLAFSGGAILGTAIPARLPRAALPLRGFLALGYFPKPHSGFFCKTRGSLYFPAGIAVLGIPLGVCQSDRYPFLFTGGGKCIGVPCAIIAASIHTSASVGWAKMVSVMDATVSSFVI